MFQLKNTCMIKGQLFIKITKKVQYDQADYKSY